MVVDGRHCLLDLGLVEVVFNLPYSVTRLVPDDDFNVFVDLCMRGLVGRYVQTSEKVLGHDVDLALHRQLLDRRRGRGRPCRPRVLPQQRLGRLPLHDQRGHGVCMLLVAVAFVADASVELHARPLLHDVRRLVRCRVQARRAGKRDVLAGRERLCAHGAGTARGVAVGMGLHRADVVATEGTLDAIEERQRASGTSDAVGSGPVNQVWPAGLVHRSVVVGIADLVGALAQDGRLVEIRAQRHTHPVLDRRGIGVRRSRVATLQLALHRRGNGPGLE